MNRAVRLEAAHDAVASALLTRNTFTEAELMDIAAEKLGDTAWFLAKRAVDGCILDRDGNIGPDIMVGGECDGGPETFTITFIG